MTPRSKVTIFIIAVFALFFAIGNGLSSLWRTGGLMTGGLFSPRNAGVYLLLGVDARGGETASRSDTIILLFLHPRTNTVDLLFVPRDSRVWIEGEDFQRKINYAHSKGGVELLQETLEQQLGVSIEGFVEVDFEGFRQAIDTLGGVEIEVEEKMYYPEEGIDIRPGKQVLNGYDSLGYVRYRSDGRGDIGRIERQKYFLRELVRQSMSLKNLVKSPQVLEELIQYTKTDLTVGEIMRVAGQFAGPVEINTHTLPGKPQMINGGSYWVIDEKQTRILIDKLVSGEGTEEENEGAGSSS